MRIFKQSLGRGISAYTLGVLACSMPAAALAQDAEVSAEKSGEITIVVTAKGREQDLQDVPLAITAFDTEQLQARGINDIRDLAAFTPSFNFYSGTGRSDPTALAVRGLAPNTSDERFQGLSVFVDGIAISGQVVGVDLTQLERVEVIKGPQSATFGRATYSGAINYITQKPTGNEVSGYVRGRVSAWEGAASDSSTGYYLGGRIDVPLVADHLWASVNGSIRNTGRIAVDPGDGSDIGREKTTSFGGVIYAEPTPNISVQLRAAYSDENDTPAVIHNQHAREWLAAGVPTVELPRGGLALWPTVVPETRNDVTGGGLSSNGPRSAAGRERERFMASMVAEYTFDSGMVLAYRGGYYEQDTRLNEDFIYRSTLNGGDPVFDSAVTAGTATVTPFAPFFTSATSERFENMSHQITLTSADDGAFRWRGGVYYFDETSLNADFSRETAANPRGQTRGQESITNYAIFGGAAFDLTESLTIDLEARYQWEDQGIEACTFCRFVTPTAISNKDQAFLPRATVEYQISEDNLLYALYSHGEKSARPTINATDLNGDGTITDSEVTFFVAEAEKLDNYEIGSKNVFADGRVTFNLAAFYQKVSNQQLITQEPTTRPDGSIAILSGVRNVGGSDIWGFEADLNFAVTPMVDLFGSIGYAKQEFTSTTPLTISSGSAVFFPDTRSDGTVLLDGKSQANVPRWTGNMGAAYRDAIGNSDWELALRADASYRGSFFADIGNIAKVEDSWKVNLRGGLHNEAISIEAFVRNLFNDHTATGAFLGGGAFFCGFRETDTATFGTGGNQRCLFAGVPAPREVGIEATLRF